ncbi:hypothetical protein BS47DRAFT_1347559 [Hydnum rufescens UP504]|uniref:Uncharacterized protein n=1 Tax=Hydnum rufescens UP504 TaxID=1448309 RepID=A0A9P6ARQ7_9AGAM|nr:hypothetical protein BS47DRAFT_1347559 [Hydnum rufescens UP504]
MTRAALFMTNNNGILFALQTKLGGKLPVNAPALEYEDGMFPAPFLNYAPLITLPTL